MSRQLVFIHGRAQEGLAPLEEKRKWIAHLRAGMEKSGLELPVGEHDVHFPYYGNALAQLAAGRPAAQAARVIQRGFESDAEAQEFFRRVVEEVGERYAFTGEQLAAAAGSEGVIGRGFLNEQYVLAVLRLIDEHFSALSSLSIAIATNDVHRYLTDPRVSGPIDDGVELAVTPGVETIVVAHSLGTIIAYLLLRDRAAALGWNVPRFITLGSPLGVNAVRRALNGVRTPSVVGGWQNAYDPDDVVALRPLTPPWFDVEPPVTNMQMYNPTPNRHGIAGYLEDQGVAQWIHDALVAT